MIVAIAYTAFALLMIGLFGDQVGAGIVLGATLGAFVATIYAEYEAEKRAEAIKPPPAKLDDSGDVVEDSGSRPYENTVEARAKDLVRKRRPGSARFS